MLRRGGAQTLEFPDVAAPGGHLLEVEDLHTAFRTGRGTVRAVDGVSFTVDRGKTLGIVGESGSGKTVLARSIMGLLPLHDVIRSGTVHFAGHDLTAMEPAQLRQVWGAELSMIFQDPMTALNPVKRIGRQITESLRLHLRMDRSEANATAIELLRQVGIPSPGHEGFLAVDGVRKAGPQVAWCMSRTTRRPALPRERTSLSSAVR